MKHIPHPSYPALLHSLQRLLPKTSLLSQHVFRMVNPRFCKDADIVSGIGGSRSSGRWNLRGQFRCTYASFKPETALAESLAACRCKNLPDEKALPRTLVCIDVHVTRSLDLRDGKVRSSIRVSKDRMIQATWWRENFQGNEAITQALGRAAFCAGIEALIVPSAADKPHGANVIVFPENLGPDSELTVATPVKTR